MPSCSTCGLVGPHADDRECIAALARELTSLRAGVQRALDQASEMIQGAKVVARDAREAVDKLNGDFLKHTANGKGADHAPLPE